MAPASIDLGRLATYPDAGKLSLAPSMPETNSHPLGPLLCRTQPHRPATVRFWAAAVIGGAILVFSLAAGLDPPDAGFGAHEQLGLGPCAMPIILGVPCPTCGMTTAFAYLAHGRPGMAFHAQPAGFVLAIAVLVAALLAVQALITGRSIAVNWYRVTPPRLALGLAAVLLLGWAYKLVTTLALG
jgi:hypothetical protein